MLTSKTITLICYFFTGMIEIKEHQTAAFLVSKILETIESYDVMVDQIFSVTCDNGANMLAAVKGLKREFDSFISHHLQSNEDLKGTDSDSDSEIENESSPVECSEDISEKLSAHFEEQLNLVRCAVHTLQLAILGVINRTDKSIQEITAIAKKCKGIKYKTHFDHHGATFPPVWSQTRWGGIYKMLNCFRRQKDFFYKLAFQFEELSKYPN